MTDAVHCAICSKTFLSARSLADHARDKHENPKHAGPKIHACPFCHGKEVTVDDSVKSEWFWVECHNEACQSCGPIRETGADAILAWNTRGPIR